VVTAGRGGKPGESRLQLIKDNIGIVRSISEKLKGYQGILIIVANPVDVLTYFYQKYTGMPASRVIGTGTLLDTARLREAIANRLNIEPKTIHAQVVGEHGDSEVVLWSRANIGGISIRNWSNWKPEFEKTIEDEVRTAAFEIIKRKGSTNHAIGLVTAALLKWILRGERRVTTVSSVRENVLGVERIAISLPSIISEKGVERTPTISLSEREEEKLRTSAQIIHEAIRHAEG
jgi:L-lactate dehydrogenase